jgi:hypothetical protein
MHAAVFHLTQRLERGTDEECAAIVSSFTGGVDVEGKRGRTALMWAVHEGRLLTIDALARRGASLGKLTKHGFRPLCTAAALSNGSLQAVVQAFGEAVVRQAVNAREWAGHRWTPLHRAAAAGVADNVRLLLLHGADVVAKDERGRTPEDVARAAGHDAVAAFLAEVSHVCVARCRAPRTPRQARLRCAYARSRAHSPLVVDAGVPRRRAVVCRGARYT